MTYISREAAIEAVEKHKDEMAKTGGVSNIGKAFYLIGQDHAIDVLRIVPAADVKPVVRGEWKQTGDHSAICTACGETTFVGGVDRTGKALIHKGLFNFCPNCGADMRKDDVGDKA